QLALESLQMRIRAWKDRLVEAALHPFELGLEHAPGGELQQTHAFVRSARHPRAERAGNPRGPPAVACAGPPSLFPGAREGVVESAVRIVAAVEDDGAQVGAFADLLQGAGQAPRACVGLERHSILLEKIAAHGGGIDATRLEIGFGEARRGIALDLFEQAGRPGGAVLPLQGAAAPARAVAPETWPARRRGKF